MEQLATDTHPSVSTTYVMAIALGFAALALSLALPWIYWGQRRSVRHVLLGSHPPQAALVGLFAGALFALFAWYAFHRVPALHQDLVQLERLLPFDRLSSFHLLVMAVSAGVGEEVLFRGAIQHHLGLWATAFLFGLMHPLSVAYVVYATVAGLLLGWLSVATHSLLAPILCHTAIDALLLWAARRESLQRFESSRW